MQVNCRTALWYAQFRW